MWLFELDAEASSILHQPTFPLSPIRQDLVDLIPESIAVIPVVKMAKLVHDEIVYDFGGSHHALPMKVHSVVPPAACPTVSQIPYTNVGYTNANSGCIEGDSVCQALQSFFGVKVFECLFCGFYSAGLHHISA